MCDWRQRCLGGVPHYSKESSLHSCSVCGNLGAELLKHWLSSQQEMENNQALFRHHLLHISRVWQRAGCREAPGAAQRSAAQAAAGGWGRLRAGAVPRRRRWHSGPRTVQRLSHPPGFPGSPRAVGGTGLPVPPEGTGRNQVRIRRWHSRTPGQGRVSSFTD